MKAELQVSNFGSNPGGLRMHTYVPEGMPPRAPLVVAMHGCSQNATAYANAGWNDLADKWKFYVVYPESTSFGSCFKWFDALHTRRGSGEAASINQMVDWMKSNHDVDPERVFVTGLSAGGGMTSVMLAAYPDVFAAGAIMAGLPYRCADSQATAGSCMSGKDLSADAWGDLVRNAYSGHKGPYPRVSIWHGTTDFVVNKKNMDELVEQWTNVHGLATTASSTGVVGKASHAEFKSAAGEPLVESWTITGMGHGTPVDPGFDPAGGCGTAGAFILDVGICSSYHAGLFFGLDPSNPNPGPGPSDGGTDPEGDPDGGSGSDAGVDPQPWTCREVLATNQDHFQARRATRCGSDCLDACAVGSKEFLGLRTAPGELWLREVSAGYFETGRCR
ncbi:MAG: PHB depolymerase family esterase [Myxococcaceae bacterium]